MKRFILLAAFLAACQPTGDSAKLPIEKTTTNAVQDDVVALRLNDPVSEPRACIIPIQIENGLDDPTSVTMIAFNLTGPGEDAKGNMFAPVADAGEISEARVIVEGQSCDAYDTISIPEIRCTSGEETCDGKIKLIDGGGLGFSQSG
jgi:hypothetical protein